MAPTQLTCRIRVDRAEEPQESAVFALRDCPDVGIEIRTQWAREVMKFFAEPHDRIRPWDFLARLDGSVKSITPSSSSSSSECEVYPARFQVPPSNLHELDCDQKVRRTKMFALASLLYEIMRGTVPFEELSDDEVQRRFSDGNFPDDTTSLPNSLYICSGWSEEFSQELARRSKEQDVNILQRVSNYAKAHPVLTGIQVAGLTLSAVSFLAVPVLGAVGFTATGPVAGSLAAAWQGSIGAVQANSLFAWCQSAAMGGTALNAIQVAGVAGAALTRVADVPGLAEKFKSCTKYRNPQAA